MAYKTKNKSSLLLGDYLGFVQCLHAGIGPGSFGRGHFEGIYTKSQAIAQIDIFTEWRKILHNSKHPVARIDERFEYSAKIKPIRRLDLDNSRIKLDENYIYLILTHLPEGIPTPIKSWDVTIEKIT